MGFSSTQNKYMILTNNKNDFSPNRHSCLDHNAIEQCPSNMYLLQMLLKCTSLLAHILQCS